MAETIIRVENLHELGLCKDDVIKELKKIREKLKNGTTSYFHITEIERTFSDSEYILKDLDLLIYGLQFSFNMNRSGRKLKEPTAEQLEQMMELYRKYINGHISYNDFFKEMGISNQLLKRWLLDRGLKLR